MKDKKLLQSLKRSVHKENLSTVEVLELIARIEEDGACLRNGYSSMYQYLTKGLLYSEGAAMRRLATARVMKLYPEVRELLVKRKVSLCTVSLVAKRVKDGDGELVGEIVGKSKREVEELLALRDGKTVLKEQVRPVAVKRAVIPDSNGRPQREEVQTPCPITATSQTEKAPSYVIEERMEVRFSTTKETFALVERVRELLSNRFPKGATLEELFEIGLKEVISKEQKRIASLGTRKAKLGDPDKRYIPAALRKAVLERDNHQCTYRYQDGTVCGSSWQLEFDHIIPVALGGRTEFENLRCCCRAHNGLLAKDAGLYKKTA